MGVVGRSFLRLEKIPMDTLVLGANYIWYLEAKIGKFRARISIGIFCQREKIPIDMRLLILFVWTDEH